jgi:tRNA modification GTPase
MAHQGLSARVCLLTPEARGAVAVVRVWGADALQVVDAAFRPARGTRLAESSRERPLLGRLGTGLGDEVVAVIVGKEPPEVEVHCHGGAGAVGLVIESLVAVGAERLAPTSWIEHDSRSTIEAQARVDLFKSLTARTAEILLEQVHGALARELDEIIQLCERDTARALAGIDRLIAASSVGLRLTSGWSIALAGRPNVGKSRLLNALAGYERAIVDPTPGTTRDVVTVRTAVDGWPIEIADTAGLRDAGDSLEAAGIERARARQAGSDLTVLVLDRSEPLTAADHGLIAALPDALVVANKVDLPAAWWQPSCRAIMSISAERGDGLEHLALALARRLVPESPDPGSGVPFRHEHVAHLRAARLALGAGDTRRAIEALEPLRAGAVEAGPTSVE